MTYENTTRYDQEAIWALTLVFSRTVQKKRFLLRRLFLLMVGSIGLAGGLVLLMVFSALDTGSRVICAAGLIVGAFALGEGLFLRRIMAWSTRRSLRKQGDSMERRFVFSGEAFQGSQPGMETRFSYETVKGVWETEGYFVLQMDTGHGMVVDKTGFTQGTADGFRQFLAERTGLSAEWLD